MFQRRVGQLFRKQRNTHASRTQNPAAAATADADPIVKAADVDDDELPPPDSLVEKDRM